MAAAAPIGCGGGDDGASTSPTQSPEGGAALPQRVEEAAKRSEARRDEAGGGRSATSAGESASEGGGGIPHSPTGGGPASTGGASGQGGPGDSTKDHQDSGGGSEQFRTPNGDNSIQESGREASASERESAAVALHAFYDARAAADWDTACSYLALSAVAPMEAAAKQAAQARGDPVLTGCADVLRAFSSTATHESLVEAAEHIDVGAFRVQGDHGLLLYHGVRGHDYAIQMIREDGSWKVGGLVGTPLS